jgi:hypothetical protein
LTEFLDEGHFYGRNHTEGLGCRVQHASM